ncbi:M48 family metalloprotease [Aminirod propionatiphilus]|uniref:M48 family metalloprotease n=1 Tax=Aminirod propionatiphilus TaxID=3415223 RepID=A0ACD1DSL1_9BACT|nr:M48 family metalloprotease [Synergistota bacterium]
MRDAVPKGLCVALLALAFLAAGVAVATPAFAEEITERELALGRKTALQVEERWPRLDDPLRTARLDMILSRLVPHAERALPFEVRLVEADDRNAFSLSGGILFVTEGMLSFVKSDAELAGLLAHEMAHAERRHVLVQVARNERLSVLGLAVTLATGGTMGAFLAANLVQVAVMNAYSRDLEEEADRRGLDLVVEAGYPPAGMVTLLERLQEEQLRRPWVDPGIYQSHPDYRDRIAYLVSTIRSRGWPLHRKEALNLLRPTLVEEGESLLLCLDGEEICRTTGDRTKLESLARSLRRWLQLETVPYEIRTGRTSQGDPFLMLGNNRIPLPLAVDPEAFRRRLIEGLARAKSLHPIADYLL